MEKMTWNDLIYIIEKGVQYLEPCLKKILFFLVKKDQCKVKKPVNSNVKENKK